MMTNDQYETHEILSHRRKETALAALPLSERQENRRTYAADMAAHPGWIGQKVEWILSGDYGYGPYVIMRRALESSRMNHAALLGQMLGVLDYECSPLEARKAYLSMTPAAQAKVTECIQSEIKSHTTNNNS